jgi:hypothetical protein
MVALTKNDLAQDGRESNGPSHSEKRRHGRRTNVAGASNTASFLSMTD